MIGVIDIETSGLEPAIHDVIEVGCVFAEHRVVRANLEFSLDFDVEKAQPKALEINGWGIRPFAPLLPVKEALDQLDEWVDECSLVMSWHSHFDFAFLGELYRRNGRSVPWSHRRVLDLPSLAVARRGIAAPGRQRDIMKQLGLDSNWEGQHTALSDAGAAYSVYCELGLWEIT